MTTGVLAFLRTIVALITIAKHGGGWKSLPFLNPILWLDWFALHSFSVKTYILLPVCVAVGPAMFAISLWLVIGYSFLGYSSLQYDVLQVPSQCTVPPTTDPRTIIFIIIHGIIFLLGIVGAVLGILGVVLGILGKQFRNNGGNNVGNNGSKNFKISIAICLIVPAIVGMVVGAIKNNDPYLILVREGCYGSFVSGQFGYLDLSTAPVTVKLAMMIGLTI